MKKKLFKFATSLLAGVMLLSGCSTGGSSQASSTSSTKASNENQATDKVKVEDRHCNAETQGGLTVEELVNKFNAENDHIEVVAKYNPDMYKGLMQNLQAEAATGRTPAIVQIGWAFLDYFSNNFSYTTPQAAIDKFDSDDKNFLSDNFLPNILNLAVMENKLVFLIH